MLICLITSNINQFLKYHNLNVLELKQSEETFGIKMMGFCFFGIIFKSTNVI